MSRELELKPFLLREGIPKNTDEFVLDIFHRINPRVKQFTEENGLPLNLKVRAVYKNTHPDQVLRYNTIAEIETDGCDLIGPNGGPAQFMFSYGRWDASQMQFNETNTVGVQDVPLIVETNTKAGVNKTFYDILDDVVLLEDEVPGFPDVKKWKGVLKRDNKAAIFTRWKGSQRIYYDEFFIYAKAYTPERGFEDSDFVN